MNRKECEPQFVHAGRGPNAIMAAVAWAVCLTIGTSAYAGSIRLWPSAIVVEDTVRLGDVAELSGFTLEEEAQLVASALGAAPEPGASLSLSLAGVREALSGHGINMSSVTLRGAVQCAVARTAIVKGEESRADKPAVALPGARLSQRASVAGQSELRLASEKEPTLRQAVVDHFNRELARYGGSADVTFGAGSASLLELAGPSYEFSIRQRSGAALGSVNLDVAVLADGQTVQSVSLRATVRLLRNVVTARGPINQDAIIREKDVHLSAMYYTRLDGLGISESVAVVGQRCKRFLEPGSVIDPTDIEAVPLVSRGQIVSMESIAGGISVASSGKALSDGHLGESILVRDPNQKGVELEATVVGVGRVRIGAPVSVEPGRLALRSDR